MRLELFRRLDSHDRRIRQLERTEGDEGGGGGGDHPDTDHTTFHPLGGVAGVDLIANDGYFTGTFRVDDLADFYGAVTVHDRIEAVSMYVGGVAVSLTGHSHAGAVAEVAFVEFTSPVSVTATTSATAVLVVSAGAATYTAVPHEVEFYSSHVVAPSAAAGAQIFVGLYDGSAANPMGRLAQVRTPAAAANGFPALGRARFTPTAGSHTYQIRAYVTAGTGTVHAGAVGSDTNMPGYIKITRL